MADRSRAYLRQEFSDGERPTGTDFADLIDSFINKEDDGVRRQPNGNITIPAGLTLANATDGQDGTLRFNAGQVEVLQGGVWSPIGGEGAFARVGGGPHVAFAGGNVGIGGFATPPTHKLEVPLTGPGERVRLGNVTAHNGPASAAGAYLSHQNATGDQSFALRQDGQANTDLNAGPGAELALMQGGAARLRINSSGNVTITPQLSVTINGNTQTGGNLQVGSPPPGQARNLSVTGDAFKPGGGPFTPLASDARVKRDVKPLDVGLQQVRGLKPVYYKFNGKAGMPDDGREYVGLIAQDVSEVVPFLVQKGGAAGEAGEDREMRDLLTYDPGPLTYILINAVRELAERVEQLEARLAANDGGQG
jgi:hypothetical protein